MHDPGTGKTWSFQVVRVQLHGGNAPLEDALFENIFAACSKCEEMNAFNDGHRYAIEPVDCTPKAEEPAAPPPADDAPPLDNTPPADDDAPAEFSARSPGTVQSDEV